MSKKIWTKKSYEALFGWINPDERELSRQTLINEGLNDIVDRLERAPNLGIWYSITREAAASVGPHIIRKVAKQAERELNQLTKINK